MRAGKECVFCCCIDVDYTVDWWCYWVPQRPYWLPGRWICSFLTVLKSPTMSGFIYLSLYYFSTSSYLLSVCVLICHPYTFLVKYLFKSFAHFLLGALFSYYWVLRVLYIFYRGVCVFIAVPDTTPFLDVSFVLVVSRQWLVFAFSYQCLSNSRCSLFWWSPTYQYFSFLNHVSGIVSTNSA